MKTLYFLLKFSVNFSRLKYIYLKMHSMLDDDVYCEEY